MYSDEMIDLVTRDGAILGYAIEIEFPDDWVRAHTGVGDILIDGHTYTGVGDLGEISEIASEGDEKPVRVKASLNGLNVEMVGQALKSKTRGLSARLMLNVFDNVTNKLIRSENAVIGFVVDYDISLSGGSGVIEVSIGDEFELYEMPAHKYWTDENHRLEHPDDRICRYVAQMGDREIYWGSGIDAVKFNTVV